MAHELKLAPRKGRLRGRHQAIAAATVLLSLSFLGGAAATGVTRIVDIDHGGLFGLRVGDSRAHVRHVLGRPDDVTNVGSEVHWFYARFSLEMFIDLRTKRVTDLFTTDARAKTASGIGLGSSEQAIISAYPDALCSPGPSPHGRSCIVGGKRSVTDFDLAGGHVDSIDIQPAHRLPHPLNFLIDLTSGSMFNIALGQSETQVRDTARPARRQVPRPSGPTNWMGLLLKASLHRVLRPPI
jgi:hypothetical protein